jgi:hypothetical protein
MPRYRARPGVAAVIPAEDCRRTCAERALWFGTRPAVEPWSKPHPRPSALDLSRFVTAWSRIAAAVRDLARFLAPLIHEDEWELKS